MRKFVVAVVVVAMSAAVFAGVAAAQTDSLSISATPNPVAAGQSLTLSGVLAEGDVSGETIAFTIYAENTCTTTIAPFAIPNATTDNTGAYSNTFPVPASTVPGIYYVQAADTDEGSLKSACLPVGVGSAAVPPPPPGIFLCYSADQTQPGVWPKDVAAELLKQGYWLPYAVSGNQAGGTNLGGFNLVCNIASTQSVSDSFVGGDGTQLGSQYAGATIGLYPKVGG